MVRRKYLAIALLRRRHRSITDGSNDETPQTNTGLPRRHAAGTLRPCLFLSRHRPSTPHGFPRPACALVLRQDLHSYLLCSSLPQHSTAPLEYFKLEKKPFFFSNVLQLCECVRHLEASLVCTEQPQSASCRLDSSGRLRLQLPGRHGTAIQPHTKPRVHCAGAVRRSTVPLATRGVYRCVSAGQVEGQWRGTHVGSG